MTIRVFILFILMGLSLHSSGQNFRDHFNEIKSNGDTTAILNLLKNWQRANSNDPELYIAFYNYYANRSMKEVVALKSGNANAGLQLTDPKSGKTVGSLSGEIYVDLHLLQKGFNYIDTAIEKFPDRLDMRFGEIYMLGKIPDYNKFTAKLITTIDYGEKIGLKWKWADGKPLDDPKNFMLGSEQSYVTQLFNAGDQEADRIKAIAETVLKYYPDHVENLSNLAISYLVKKDYKNALSPLLKAEKIAPSDGIVLNNIAYCYNALGNKPLAIKYYELTEKYGDQDAKDYAKKKINELKKN